MTTRSASLQLSDRVDAMISRGTLQVSTHESIQDRVILPFHRPSPDPSCSHTRSRTEGVEAPFHEVSVNIYQGARRQQGQRIRFRQSAFLRYQPRNLRQQAIALPDETITLMEGSLADADGPVGFNAMKADAGRVTLDNILEVTERLAFIRKNSTPRLNRFFNEDAFPLPRIFPEISPDTPER